MDGIAVVDKPEGWTSHDVVAKFRGVARTKRVGHLGTLDPMATGVLPLAVNAGTRLVKYYVGAQKTYDADIRLGFATDTYDRTGRPVSEPANVSVNRVEVENELAKFRGAISQIPPQYSAKKVGGVTAHNAAREGLVVQLAPIHVTIHELDLLGFEGDHIRLHIRCSAGTYIRTIADDLGKALGCGAHLDSLRRLAAGDFTIDQARPLQEVAVIPLPELLPQFPIFAVDEQMAASIRQGRTFGAPQCETPYLKALSETGSLIAICKRTALGAYHPETVIG